MHLLCVALDKPSEKCKCIISSHGCRCGGMEMIYSSCLSSGERTAVLHGGYSGISPKYLAAGPSSAKTVTTPGRSTCRVGTWAGRIPNAPVSVGTSTCFTLAPLKNTCRVETEDGEMHSPTRVTVSSWGIVTGHRCKDVVFTLSLQCSLTTFNRLWKKNILRWEFFFFKCSFVIK